MRQFAGQDEIKVFCGNAHPALASSVCEYLGIPLGKIEVFFGLSHSNFRNRYTLSRFLKIVIGLFNVELNDLSQVLFIRPCNLKVSKCFINMISGGKSAEEVKPGNIVNSTIPLHPGAIKYYREVGIKLPEKLIP